MARGSGVFAPINQAVVSASPITGADVNDLFLHALFARVTLSNNEVIEFETKYCPSTNTIELQIDDSKLKIFNELLGVQRGERFEDFIDWLIGKSNLVTADGDGFVSSGSIDVWYGAKRVSSDGIAINLPTEDSSSIGYNLITSDSFSGSARISIIWKYLCGSNDSFELRTSTTISDPGGATATVTNDETISTVGLVAGDIRETLIIDTGSIIEANNVIQTIITRNFSGSSDPMTESINIVGMRVSLV